jgi:hypothetical protein
MRGKWKIIPIAKNIHDFYSLKQVWSNNKIRLSRAVATTMAQKFEPLLQHESKKTEILESLVSSLGQLDVLFIIKCA